jgi:hypothetical protein
LGEVFHGFRAGTLLAGILLPGVGRDAVFGAGIDAAAVEIAAVGGLVLISALGSKDFLKKDWVRWDMGRF